VNGVPGTFSSITAELRAVVATEPIDMARAALVIAKLEYPRLDPAPSLSRLRELGDQAAHATKPLAGAPARDVLATISHELYEKAGFAGNRAHYDDFRNSLLNVVLERRLGIPITLALVFMEVARQANVDVQGVGFPGRFLLRVPEADPDRRPLILDPYDHGRELGELDCRALLSEMMGEDSEYSPDLLRPCSSRQMLARMLNNLKRTYVEMRSFPQAYAATDMILAVDPTLLPELRDRGLLAYHLDDFPSALRDLEDYLRLNAWSEDSTRKEREEIWNHVRNLRRRVAGLN
jgi:regulator of sirC expression with transglutaminase-like and TPR domain